MIGLYVEIFKVFGWGVVLFYLLKYRKGLPINIFYIMLISNFLMLHSGLYDIVYKDYVNKNFIWFFTDITVMTVYIMWIRKYKKYQKMIRRDIKNFINNAHDKEGVIKDNKA